MKRGAHRSKPKSMFLGSWQSDRSKTLAYWGFRPRASRKYKRLLHAKDFFGNLRWHVTPRRIYYWMPGDKRPAFSPYRIIWTNSHSIAVVLDDDGTERLFHIHFKDSNHFYMLVGMANCEWFKRVKANYAMQRSSRVGTPLAGTGPGADRLRSASSAPSARRR